MTLQGMFAIWDWPSVGGLIVVGLVTGYVLLPMTWPIQTASSEPYPLILTSVLSIAIGTTFFAFLLIFRELDGVQFAERTVTTLVQWVIFAVSMSLGLRWRGTR